MYKATHTYTCDSCSHSHTNDNVHDGLPGWLFYRIGIGSSTIIMVHQCPDCSVQGIRINKDFFEQRLARMRERDNQ